MQLFPTIENCIDFALAAIIILIVILACESKKTINISSSNRIFYFLVIALLIDAVLDVLMNVVQSYSDIFGTTAYMILRSLFNMAYGLSATMAYQYIRSYQIKEKEVLKKCSADYIVLTSFFVVTGFGLLNIFTGMTSSVDANGKLVDGPLYLANFICPLLTILVGIVMAIKNRGSFTQQQFAGIIKFTCISIAFVLLEVILAPKEKVLLSIFGATIGLLVVHMSLDSAEKKQLVMAIEENQKARADAEKAKEIAERLKGEAEEAKITAEAAYMEAEDAKDVAVNARKLAEESRASAIRANQAKSDFLARMSHEIRTPMNAVIGLNEMIINESKEPQIIEYSKDVTEAANNLLSIINDILDFSKIESGKMRLIEDEYDLKKVLKEEFMMFTFRTQEKNIKLEFDIDPEIPRMLIGDDVRLKQIFTNLLGNAVKYTDQGTITLKASLEGRGRSAAMIKFSVKDTGKGIREEDIAKLYEAFERIDEKANKNIQGTGLGINIVSQLLTLMGSKLEVDSVYGLGSQFSFTIRQPVASPDEIGDFYVKEVQKEDNASEEDYKHHLVCAPTARVLVVDDNMLNIKVFLGLLKDTKMIMDSASSGAEALKLTQRNKYDVIFMDHMMPEMDGLECRQRIISQEGGLNHETPIIALVANAVKGAYEEYINYGFVAVNFKPTTQAELNESLWKFIPKEKIEAGPDDQ